MDQNFRLSDGGLINRDKKLSFKFNSKTYYGFQDKEIDDEVLYAATLGLISIKSLNKVSVCSKGINFSEPDG